MSQHSVLAPIETSSLAAQLPLAPSQWQPAIAASGSVDTVPGFFSWMEAYIKPIVHYGMVACGSGIFVADTIRVNRLLFRDFSPLSLESLRDATGVISLRGLGGPLGGLRMVDTTHWGRSAPPWDFGAAHRVGIHTHCDSTRRSGTFFLFGGMQQFPDMGDCSTLQLLAPSLHALLLRTMESDTRLQMTPEPSVLLTRRETEMLSWLVAGRSTTEIAEQTHRSAHTINNQIRAILRKLRANNRTEAAFLALCLGLVPPREESGRTRMIAAQRRSLWLRLPS